MKPENIQHLRAKHKFYFHESIEPLPDGWFDLIDNFLSEMHELGDLVQSVSVRFERDTDGLRAFVFPEMIKWTPGQYASLRAVQRALYGLSRCTCVVCGQPGEMLQASAAGGENQVLCPEHVRDYLSVIYQRQTFAKTLTALRPPPRGWPVDYPERMSEVLQEALKRINKQAIDHQAAGKVWVRAVELIHGMLFLRVVFDNDVDIPTQIDINDIVSWTHVVSDEAFQTGADHDH